ncbi:uncharacterized protein LY79DRAFT_570183 [Colletotrichum navitas]|uniref:Secreted protein n=1 Tax=Colletotrichum navitas TaxID=681940 RepID=A0AAD8PM38_9PEZI|nr:uncharacterized protein LY79DRAFT_570183 [Colletotrichum navitas]KAK1570253.1 hypothetical protein LY79DRAFT_570183 [Colletotrichum navitas]
MPWLNHLHTAPHPIPPTFLFPLLLSWHTWTYMTLASCCFSLHTGRAAPEPRGTNRWRQGRNSHKLCLERRTATFRTASPPYHAT